MHEMAKLLSIYGHGTRLKDRIVLNPNCLVLLQRLTTSSLEEDALKP